MQEYQYEKSPLIKIKNIPKNKSTVYELKILIKLSIPVIITNLVAWFLLTESIVMNGRVTKYELDGVTLANSIIMLCGIALATGLCTACDTFFAQMYTSQYKKSIGMVLQKSLLILLTIPFLLIGLYINLEPIFILIGQDPIVSKNAANFITIFSPSIFFVFIYLILTRYLQNQAKVLAPMIFGVLINVLNIICQYIAIFVFNYDYRSSAIIQGGCFLVYSILLIVYIKFSGVYKDTWNGWTKEAFLDWAVFLRLAIPGAAMVMFECFCFEITTILSGVIGPTELAAQTALIQMESVTFMISFGLSVAVNVRVGHCLGVLDYNGAKLAYRCSLLIMFCVFVVFGCLEMALIEEIPKIFTNDIEARKIAIETTPYVIIVQFFDAIGTVTLGALRGCGRQKLCLVFVFIAYYVLGLPVSIYLTFYKNFSVKGLWIGLDVSLVVCVISAMIFTNFFQDWKIQAYNCAQRIKKISLYSPGKTPTPPPTQHPSEYQPIAIEQADYHEILDTEISPPSTQSRSDTQSPSSLLYPNIEEIVASFSSNQCQHENSTNYCFYILLRLFIYLLVSLFLVGAIIYKVYSPELYYNSSIYKPIQFQ